MLSQHLTPPDETDEQMEQRYKKLDRAYRRLTVFYFIAFIVAFIMTVLFIIKVL